MGELDVLNPGDIKFLVQRQTWAKGPSGQAVQAMEVHFSVRGHGDYTLLVPCDEYSYERVMQLAMEKAYPIAELMDHK